MNLIEFIYAVLMKFVPVPQGVILGLEKEAREWYFAQKEKEGFWKKIITNYLETWWFRTFLAFMFIFAIKWVSDFINPKDDDYDNND